MTDSSHQQGRPRCEVTAGTWLALPATVPLSRGRAVTIATWTSLWDWDWDWAFPDDVPPAAWAVVHDADEPRSGHYLGRQRGPAELRLDAAYHVPVLARAGLPRPTFTFSASLLAVDLDDPDTADTLLRAFGRRALGRLRAATGGPAQPFAGRSWHPVPGLRLALPLVLRAGAAWVRVDYDVKGGVGLGLHVDRRGPSAGNPWVGVGVVPLGSIPQRQDAPSRLWTILREAGADAAELGRRLVAARIAAGS